MSKANPRKIALNILNDTIINKQMLDFALSREFANNDIASNDRGLIRMIVSTCLRRKGQIDFIIDKCLNRPLPFKLEAVKNILRIGVTQLIFMDIPAYAAVNTAVELTKSKDFMHQKNMVNAILRRIDREQDIFTKEISSKEYLNHPKWLKESWEAAYGKEKAQAIIKANMSEALLDISVKENPAKWADKLDGTLMPTGSIRLSSYGNVIELEGFTDGSWWVQDIGASIAVKLAGEIKDKKALDICAAPGGKTMQLLAGGAKVTAIDNSPERIERLKENLARTNLQASEIMTSDFIEWGNKYYSQLQQGYDLIILDAPCSATGTIRRHPDLLHLRRPNDVKNNLETQKRMLRLACGLLKKGGTLIYCVCSLEAEEGEKQIEQILETELPLKLSPIAPNELGKEMSMMITEKGEFRSLPSYLSDRGGMDGFYCARLRKNK